MFARRAAGIRVELELSGRRLKKALDYANRERIPLVLIYGENERDAGAVTLRDMRSGEELTVALAGDRLVDAIAQLLS
ncbi:His/Gly/Thr/Pro-type tRNA ligase C-terminal domain-containing protein [Brevibacillus sp. WF146]|uniref:His/Gly/Thr/Pro-type tRNA ligase C-terminal domain-containing protein n=1 Tax=Brevibacillus sp. WF146 TaxID=319501 RepID=UPI0007ECAF7C|nr:His/Gly/Thr/Pro-type tRNA ligase C-terminal domain-containing protein [Brevibacillus sp. WF146]UYZ13228.1 His/Gly/Thr/Pro-type tRNA ligase C-terminal domain-containing protein [Brevibacillus sp. WF146]